MKMKKVCLCLATVILLVICQLSGISALEDNESKVKETVANFVQYIKTRDLVGFRKSINPSGLLVIRNFVTGGFGTRGKDIRNHYQPSQADFEFKVPEEVPVSIEWLFAESIKSKISDIPIKRVNGLSFGFDKTGQAVSPSTMELITICSKIQEYNKDAEMQPAIFILNDREFALTESDYIMGLSIGGWAVFKRVDERYYLRAIMDFR